MRNAEDASFSHRSARVRRKLAGAFKSWLCAFSLEISACRINWLGSFWRSALGKGDAAEQTQECHGAAQHFDTPNQPTWFERHLPELRKQQSAIFLPAHRFVEQNCCKSLIKLGF
jgi:hypothetical protein